MSTRVLFVGDLAATGFGSVTTDLGRALLAEGLDVRFLSQNDLRAEMPEPFASRTVDVAFYEFSAREAGVSGVRSLLGDIVGGVPGHRLVNGQPFGDWKPQAVLILSDFAAARILYHRFSDALSRVPVFHYCPVEGVDLPPLWAQLWSALQPVAMSKFGRDEIARVTGSEPPMIYHGVDQTTFYPVSSEQPILAPRDESAGAQLVTLTSKAACKRFFGFSDDVTLILRADRLMPRKRYDSLLRSLDPVLATRPNAHLLLHCAKYDQGGFLPDVISKMRPESRVRTTVTDRPGLPRPVLAALYNAADLYVSSSAEGFGLTIAEALACGVPAVGIDYSAVPEVIGPAGCVVPVGGLYDNEYAHRWAYPDEEKFAEAVEFLLDHPARRRALGALGPKHVAQHFQWSDAARRFAALLAPHEPA